MAWMYNKDTGVYECYDSQVGGVVQQLPEERLTFEQELDKSKLQPGEYCGACDHDPCLVELGKLCCHEMVRYGHCGHSPLPYEERFSPLYEDREVLEGLQVYEDGTPVSASHERRRRIR